MLSIREKAQQELILSYLHLDSFIRSERGKKLTSTLIIVNSYYALVKDLVLKTQFVCHRTLLWRVESGEVTVLESQETSLLTSFQNIEKSGVENSLENYCLSNWSSSRAVLVLHLVN